MVTDPKENKGSKQNDERAEGEELQEEQLKDIAGGTAVPPYTSAKGSAGSSPQVDTDTPG